MENTKKRKLFWLTGKGSLSKIILFIPSDLFFVFQKIFLFNSDLYSSRDPQRYEKPEDRVIDQYSLKKEMWHKSQWAQKRIQRNLIR